MFSAVRTKLTIFFVIFLVVSLGLLSVALQRIVVAEFEHIEENNARVAIVRAMEAIRSDGQFLGTWARDIGPWDETYDFVESGDRVYIRNNFSPESIENLDLDLLAFVNDSNTMAWAHISDEQQIEDFDYESLPGIGDHGPEWTSSTGVVGLHRMNDNTVYLLAVHPILTSEYGGPSRGATIFGRRLDNARFEELILSSVADFSLRPFTAMDMPEGSVDGNGLEDGNLQVSRANGETSARTVLSDFKGEPVLTLEVRAHKDVATNGARAANTIMIVYAAIGLFGFLVLQFLFWRMRP